MIEQNTPSITNWNAFWNFHLGSWDGRWTRYQPSGELLETFFSCRTFESDIDKKIINQFNRYVYQDGKIGEKNWSYSLENHCKKDGFMHPASDYMRGLAFEDGAAAWLVPQALPEQYFPMELFLANKNVRFSVGMLYGLNGDLQRTACIREQRHDFDYSAWSKSMQLVPAWNIGSHWHGITFIIGADLGRTMVHETFNMTPEADHKEYFFPDNIILRCPAKLNLHKQFTISGIWLESENQLKTITASYGKNSKLIDVRLQHLSR